MVSVIVPTLNERARVAATLSALQDIRRSGHEVLVVDGGSSDDTRDRARPWVDRVLRSPKGRALQLNAGARESRGDTLLFLHADTWIPPDALAAFLEEFPEGGRLWGWFDVSLSGRRFVFRVVENLMNLRSRLSRITTGDHAIFVQRGIFEKVGGYPEIPLMEDIALSRLLKREGRPLCLDRRVVTSSRRWEEQGILRTIVLMWRLRLAYALGADPGSLAASYYSPSGHDDP